MKTLNKGNVYDNNLMLKSQNKINAYKNSYFFTVWEKALINNNIKISNMIFIKNNKKIGLWNIIAKIIKILSGRSFKITIINDKNKIFSKGEEYYMNISIIKKVDKNIWKN